MVKTMPICATKQTTRTMTKSEFEAAISSVPIDAKVFFAIPGRKPLQLVKCHKEQPNQLVLGYSPLGLAIEFEYLGHLSVLASYYHASSDAALIVRIEGQDYYPERVDIEEGNIVFR